jgi:hypothetical protein
MHCVLLFHGTDGSNIGSNRRLGGSHLIVDEWPVLMYGDVNAFPACPWGNEIWF